MPSTVVIPNNYGIATFRWTFIPAGKQFTVTMGYLDTTFLGDANHAALQISNAFSISTGPVAAANMTTNWRYEGVTTLQRKATGVLIAGSGGAPITGTATASADQSPVFTTWVISKLTANAGRPYRGRMYPPICDALETTIDFNGTINASIASLQQARWTAWFNGLAAGGLYYPQLLHSSTSPAGTPTPLVSLKMRPVVGIQRRRRARGA